MRASRSRQGMERVVLGQAGVQGTSGAGEGSGPDIAVVGKLRHIRPRRPAGPARSDPGRSARPLRRSRPRSSSRTPRPRSGGPGSVRERAPSTGSSSTGRPTVQDVTFCTLPQAVAPRSGKARTSQLDRCAIGGRKVGVILHVESHRAATADTRLRVHQAARTTTDTRRQPRDHTAQACPVTCALWRRRAVEGYGAGVRR